MDRMLVPISPPHSHVEILIFNVMALGDGALESN
jgi:hypothetical protein